METENKSVIERVRPYIKPFPISPLRFLIIGIGIGILNIFFKKGLGYLAFFLILSGILEFLFRKQKKIPSNILSMGFAFLLTIVPIFWIKSYVGDVMTMESQSMVPTIPQKSKVFVQKSVHELGRGDLVVFIPPLDSTGKKRFIFRLIGLPRDTVEIKDGKVLANGEVLKEPQISSKVYYYNRGDYGKEGKVIKVPNDSYYVLGDNSSSSKDSRYLGFVPRNNIKGKAILIETPKGERIDLFHSAK